ncbi:MAG: B-4DMT family transporter [Mycobacteriaceae bacterium]|nr:B-4DMT family transporter [Mycobacteriaceae bacterium]
MTTWMTRGLAFAAAMVVVRLLQGTLINVWQTHAGLINIVLLLIFLVGPLGWGIWDGRADATANPDPDRRADLAMTWLLAGLTAGGLSGVLSWLIGIFYHGMYTGGLFSELTTFAAFTALIVFVLGVGGVAVGHWVVDRQIAKQPPSHHGLAATQDRVDTDVFAAVQAQEDQPQPTCD